MAEPRHPLWRRAGWFALLWLGGVLFLALVAYGIRSAIFGF